MNFTNLINSNNHSVLKNLRSRKADSIPFLATEENAMGVITDHDHFPYTRYWRGQNIFDSEPRVAEREAGWRPVNHELNDLLRNSLLFPTSTPEPNYCWQSACTTLYPCNQDRNCPVHYKR